MALLIDKTFNSQGISINQIYFRFGIFWSFEGNKIIAYPQLYPDKSAWTNGYNPIKISDADIRSTYEMDYNPSVNGEILSYVHNSFIDLLSTDITEDVPLLDPSTGEYQYDPSTGDLITENVITIPKIADISEMSIIDLD